MKYYKSTIPEIELKYKSGEVKKSKIRSSKDAAEIFMHVFNADTLEIVEEFMMLLLNTANNTIGWYRVSQGGITGTVADTRLILATALKAGATGIIVAHNHPSGNTKPSSPDITLSKKLNKACELLDIRLLDSLIVTTDKYYSFRDEGII